jgi:hypothetical protein
MFILKNLKHVSNTNLHTKSLLCHTIILTKFHLVAILNFRF